MVRYMKSENGELRPMSKRREEEELVVVRQICPSCGHDRVWQYQQPTSNILWKCTRCNYKEWR